LQFINERILVPYTAEPPASTNERPQLSESASLTSLRFTSAALTSQQRTTAGSRSKHGSGNRQTVAPSGESDYNTYHIYYFKLMVDGEEKYLNRQYWSCLLLTTTSRKYHIRRGHKGRMQKLFQKF